MRQMAQERASAASAPAALAEKLSAFTDGLSADEVALAQAVERTQETEVESYLGTIIPSTYHKGTSDKNALLAVGRALWEAVIDVNNIL